MYSIGKNLVKIRENLNLTQDQMADRVGVSRHTLSNLENDHTQIINRHVLHFAEINEVSPEELILGYKPEVTHQTLEQARAQYGMERDALAAEYEDKISALNALVDDLRHQLDAKDQQIADLRDHIKTKDQIITHLRSIIPPEE